MENTIEELQGECDRLTNIISGQNCVIDDQLCTILHLDETIRQYERINRYTKLPESK